MADGRRRAGDRGEALARGFLEARGFQILAANHRTRWGEIDLIAQRGPRLCFVEVKSWRTERFGDPEGWIPPAKQRRLGRLAEAWLAEHDVDCEEVTVAVVAIDWQGGAPKITFLDNSLY